MIEVWRGQGMVHRLSRHLIARGESCGHEGVNIYDCGHKNRDSHLARVTTVDRIRDSKV